MSKRHKKLIAWRKSMDLVEKIYDLTKRFPREEVYGLSSQMRRAAESVISMFRLSMMLSHWWRNA